MQPKQPCVSPGWLAGLAPNRIELGTLGSARSSLMGHFRHVHASKGLPTFSVTLSGTRMVRAEEMQALLARLHGHVLIASRALNPVACRCPWRSLVCVWPDALVTIEFEPASQLDITVLAEMPARLDELVTAFRPCVDGAAASWISMLTTDFRGGLEVRRVARLAEPLVRENYDAQVLRSFDHILADLTDPSPCGRLVIIEGIPGTGKTHLVRGLIAASGPATFVIVPASLGGVLGKPDLLSALIAAKTEAEDRPSPMVVVIEDADSCLVPRRLDNAEDVAGLLNASDRIMGATLDLRIVATTNARLTEIDAAFLRPGRLCRRVETRSLAPEHAMLVHERLAGTRRTFGKPATLAEVYAAARGNSEVSPRRKRAAGFANRETSGHADGNV